VSGPMRPTGSEPGSKRVGRAVGIAHAAAAISERTALVESRVGEREVDPAEHRRGQVLSRYSPLQMPRNWSTAVWSMSEDHR